MTKMKLKMPSKGPRVVVRSFVQDRWLLREIVSAFIAKVAEAARRASFIEDRLTQEYFRSELLRWKVGSQKHILKIS